MKLNVLITTSYYWPAGAGSAPYLTGLAEHLSGRGHRVVVATTFAHYPEWRSSAGRRLLQREGRLGVEIRRRRHYVPRRQTAAHRALYEGTLYASGLTALPMRPRPDVVIGTCPTLAGGVLAATAAMLYRAPLGLIFQDLMGLAAEQSGVAGGGGVAAIVMKAERALARRADKVAIVAEGFRGYFEAGGVTPEKIQRLRNWTRRVEPSETANETRARVGWSADELVCLHGGNMGQKQGLDNLLETAALLRGERVRIVLAGDGNDRRRLQEKARELRLANVAFMELQGPGRWEEIMQASDVLLVNQRPSVADMSLPSKLTSYFAAGRPVVAAASPESETAREIEAAGTGLIVPPDDPAALAAAISGLAGDPAAVRSAAARATSYAETHLAPERILAEYEQFVEELATRRRGECATLVRGGKRPGERNHDDA
jgi:colanic acid biosynthesis glycosyl transferase WcaI